MRTSFILHLDSLAILDKMTNEQAGILLKAMYHYQINDTLPPLDFAIDMAITPFINQFKRDSEKYVLTVEKRKLAGSKGGKQKLANASKSKQKLANLADSVSVNDIVNDSNKDIIDYNRIFEYFKLKTGKKIKKFGDKEKGQLRARLADGYSYEEIESAILTCANDAWHRKPENSHFLTLEFILRQDKLQKYSVAISNKERKRPLLPEDKESLNGYQLSLYLSRIKVQEGFEGLPDLKKEKYDILTRDTTILYDEAIKGGYCKIIE